MTIQNLILLHQEHQYWLHELDLNQDEVRHYQNSLARSAALSSEQPQEKFVRLRQELLEMLEQIDGFRHQIYAYEAQLAKRMELANRMQQLTPEEEHHTLRTAIEKFSLVFKAVKKSCSELINSNMDGA